MKFVIHFKNLILTHFKNLIFNLKVQNLWDGGGRHHTEIRINPRESLFLRILFIWLYHSATKNSKKMEFRIFFAPPNDAKIFLRPSPRDALKIFDPEIQKNKNA